MSSINPLAEYIPLYRDVENHPLTLDKIDFAKDIPNNNVERYGLRNSKQRKKFSNHFGYIKKKSPEAWIKFITRDNIGIAPTQKTRKWALEWNKDRTPANDDAAPIPDPVADIVTSVAAPASVPAAPAPAPTPVAETPAAAPTPVADPPVAATAPTPVAPPAAAAATKVAPPAAATVAAPPFLVKTRTPVVSFASPVAFAPPAAPVFSPLPTPMLVDEEPVLSPANLFRNLTVGNPQPTQTHSMMQHNAATGY